eukprot:1137613-Pelagomonas_calceolata.AAC.2
MHLWKCDGQGKKESRRAPLTLEHQHATCLPASMLKVAAGKASCGCYGVPTHHSHMMVKHLLLGMGLIWHSLRALVMMVCIWPLKKRARSGLWAPGLDSTDSMALLSCKPHRRGGWGGNGQFAI